MADSTSQLTTAQKDELMDQVKQQIAIANAQELLTVRICGLLTYFNYFKVTITKTPVSLPSIQSFKFIICFV